MRIISKFTRVLVKLLVSGLKCNKAGSYPTGYFPRVSEYW